MSSSGATVPYLSLCDVGFLHALYFLSLSAPFFLYGWRSSVFQRVKDFRNVKDALNKWPTIQSPRLNERQIKILRRLANRADQYEKKFSKDNKLRTAMAVEYLSPEFLFEATPANREYFHNFMRMVFLDGVLWGFETADNGPNHDCWRISPPNLQHPRVPEATAEDIAKKVSIPGMIDTARVLATLQQSLALFLKPQVPIEDQQEFAQVIRNIQRTSEIFETADLFKAWGMLYYMATVLLVMSEPNPNRLKQVIKDFKSSENAAAASLEHGVELISLKESLSGIREAYHILIRSPLHIFDRKLHNSYKVDPANSWHLLRYPVGGNFMFCPEVRYGESLMFRMILDAATDDFPCSSSPACSGPLSDNVSAAFDARSKGMIRCTTILYEALRDLSWPKIYERAPTVPRTITLYGQPFERSNPLKRKTPPASDPDQFPTKLFQALRLSNNDKSMAEKTAEWTAIMGPRPADVQLEDLARPHKLLDISSRLRCDEEPSPNVSLDSPKDSGHQLIGSDDEIEDERSVVDADDQPEDLRGSGGKGNEEEEEDDVEKRKDLGAEDSGGSGSEQDQDDAHRKKDNTDDGEDGPDDQDHGKTDRMDVDEDPEEDLSKDAKGKKNGGSTGQEKQKQKAGGKNPRVKAKPPSSKSKGNSKERGNRKSDNKNKSEDDGQKSFTVAPSPAAASIFRRLKSKKAEDFVLVADGVWVQRAPVSSRAKTRSGAVSNDSLTLKCEAVETRVSDIEKIPDHSPRGGCYDASIRWPDNSIMDEEETLLKAILSAHKTEDPDTSPFLIVSELPDRSTWLELNRNHEIVILASKDDVAAAPPFSLDTCSSCCFDQSALVEVHDPRWDSDIANTRFVSNLEQLMDIRATHPDQVAFVNCVSIKPFRTKIPPIVKSLSNLWEVRECRLRLPFEEALLSFGLCSMAGSFSDKHIDGGGLNTWVQVVTGVKLWAVKAPVRGQHPRADWASPKGDEESTDWRYVLLRAGDILIMRPGTQHCVFTLEDSICVGGHFYSESTWVYSLAAKHLEYKKDHLITNVRHTLTEVYNTRLLTVYANEVQKLVRRGISLGGIKDVIPKIRDLAALILLNRERDQLLPPADQSDGSESSKEAAVFLASEKLGLDLLQARSSGFILEKSLGISEEIKNLWVEIQEKVATGLSRA